MTHVYAWLVFGRLGLEVGAATKRARVLKVLEEVGLQKKAGDYVGGELPGGLNLRGLSGGEKRRLSLVGGCSR